MAGGRALSEGQRGGGKEDWGKLSCEFIKEKGKSRKGGRAEKDKGRACVIYAKGTRNRDGYFGFGEIMEGGNKSLGGSGCGGVEISSSAEVPGGGEKTEQSYRSDKGKGREKKKHMHRSLAKVLIAVGGWLER